MSLENLLLIIPVLVTIAIVVFGVLNKSKAKPENSDSLASALGWRPVYSKEVSFLNGKYSLSIPSLYLENPPYLFKADLQYIDFTFATFQLLAQDGLELYMLLEIHNLPEVKQNIIIGNEKGVTTFTKVFNNFTFNNLSEVRIENQEFNNSFKAYSGDGVLAKEFLLKSELDKFTTSAQYSFGGLMVEINTNSMLIFGNFKPYQRAYKEKNLENNRKDLFTQFTNTCSFIKDSFFVRKA